MDIHDFNALLGAARQQAEPQHLLMVFAKAVLHDDHQPQEAERFARGEGGILLPVMCLDRAASELVDFASLQAESARIGEPWQIMFVACLDGKAGRQPEAADIEAALKRMIQTIQTGGDVSRYLAFNLQGEPVRFH
ncbi:ribonucleotide reductase subunit alpha [Aquitalea denitrificans]|uniref:ribonucleotide reductase subunit alpha n=1 Tax=Aquitalea denitrificans TaxID=519081 RepID=UPI001359E983|nr:ribonucleotide reductase subunit alpha [Aquitalea denitrificans]